MKEAEQVTIIQDVIKFDITEAKIQELADKYLPLKINGLDDKEGYQVVDKARKKVAKKRIAVEKRRKQLKAEALEYGRKVDGRAKEIFEKLEPIEGHLKAEKEKVDSELERIKEEEAEKEQARIQGMIDDLQKYDVTLPVIAVAAMSDEEYAKVLGGAKSSWESKQAAEEEAKRIEHERQLREEAELKAESERLAAERAELEKIKAEQKAVQDKIESENRQMAERRANLRQQALKNIDVSRDGETLCHIDETFKSKQGIDSWLDIVAMADDEFDRFLALLKSEIEDHKKQAKIKADQESKKSAEREEQERIAREKARKEDELRRETLRPDKEKLTAFAQFLCEGFAYPEVSSDSAKWIIEIARKKIQDAGNFINERAGNM